MSPSRSSDGRRRAAVQQLAEDPGIEVTGRVEDIRPYLADAAVYVVPLRIGGGTRLKIFEAMAAGRAASRQASAPKGCHRSRSAPAARRRNWRVCGRGRDAAPRPGQASRHRAEARALVTSALRLVGGSNAPGTGNPRHDSVLRPAPSGAVVSSISHAQYTSMNVSVFGLGYVGSVSAAAFADDGHSVIGVDVNADKVAMLNAGQSPIVEPGLVELVASNVAAGRLRATTDVFEAVADSEVSLVSVRRPAAATAASI